jgi:hypothetical protein
MIQYIHWLAVQIKHCSIVDSTFTNFLMVTVFFILIGLNKAFLVLIVIKKGISIDFNFVELIFSIYGSLNISFEDWLVLSFSSDFIDDHEEVSSL